MRLTVFCRSAFAAALLHYYSALQLTIYCSFAVYLYTVVPCCFCSFAFTQMLAFAKAFVFAIVFANAVCKTVCFAKPVLLQTYNDCIFSIETTMNAIQLLLQTVFANLNGLLSCRLTAC